MDREKLTTGLILEYIKEQTTDILGFVPNDNDLTGVLLNVLGDMQNRIVEYTDYCERIYSLNESEVLNNEIHQ